MTARLEHIKRAAWADCGHNGFYLSCIPCHKNWLISELEQAQERVRELERPPSVEIRRNEDGSLDEVVTRVGGKCVFHLEQMDTNHWWMETCGTHVDFHSRKTITAMAEER